MRQKLRKICEKIYHVCRYTLRTYWVFRGKRQKRIVIFGTPEHGNLGDHALIIAEKCFFAEKAGEYQIIEITSKHFKKSRELIFSKMKNEDVICINGGGSLGNLWEEEQDIIYTIIESFPRNKIVILPQTIYFEERANHTDEVRKAKAIYEKHTNLHMFLREQESFHFAQKEFSGITDVQCVPDFVTYLDRSGGKIKRRGVLLCLRADKESIINEQEREKIIQILNTFGEGYRETTTVLAKAIAPIKRNRIFNKKLNEFRASRLVITDRLHGMLFAAITGTPCIAFDNLSGKVKGVYEWISYLEYIKILTQDDDLQEVIDSLDLEKKYVYHNEVLKPYFDEIRARF